jgi:hypothetical protein
VPDIVLISLDQDEVTRIGSRNGLIHEGDDLSCKDTLDVVHYGWLESDITGTPLQFSIVENYVVFEKRNMGEIVTIVHTSHTAPGSSGAPNLSSSGKVVGIQFAGADGKAISLHIENCLKFVKLSEDIFALGREYQELLPKVKKAQTSEERDKLQTSIQNCVEKLQSMKTGHLGAIVLLPNGSVIPPNPAMERLLRTDAGEIWLGQTKRQPLHTVPLVSIFSSKDCSKVLVKDCQLCLSSGWASVETGSTGDHPNLPDRTLYYFGNPKDLHCGVLFKMSTLPNKSTRYYFQDVRKA